MDNRLESAGMEIRELLQSFCKHPLPDSLANVRIIQNRGDIKVRFYWQHNTPLGEVWESETVASLSDFLDDYGDPLFSLAVPVTKNALVFCSCWQPSGSEWGHSPVRDTKGIVVHERMLLDDENLMVTLLNANTMMAEESRLVLQFELENYSSSSLRVWIKNLRAAFPDNKDVNDIDEVAYDQQYVQVGVVGAGEGRKCNVVITDDGFCDEYPIAWTAAGDVDSCFSFQIAYDFYDEPDYAESEVFYLSQDWAVVSHKPPFNKGVVIGKRAALSAVLATMMAAQKTVDDKMRVLTFAEIAVRTNSFQLEKHYKIEECIAKLHVMRKSDGKLLTKTVPAGYCPEKNFFFILEADYKSLSKWGIIMCRLVPRAQLDAALNGQDQFGDGLNPESLLHQYGYSVSTTSGLTSQQRKMILLRVMQEKVYTPIKLLSFLDWLIAKNRTNPKMDDAVIKWQEDREFIAGVIVDQSQLIIEYEDGEDGDDDDELPF